MSIEDVDFQNQLDVGPIGPTGPRGFTGLAGQNGFNGSTGPTDPAGLSPGTAQFVNEQTITLPGELSLFQDSCRPATQHMEI
ncbi:hypothetical protein J40TS1_06120 [Paenibacillus montaniterrae]|uniref:Collagen-like protein n=1 Tax=Paenibacillus montaniterrae TaxID=429341 RepID=A0A919YK72_9BACL|nr:hypothetical protein [Paenibacillus montaniterrae]GIP14970.1 hypothetical protein J40TS1_06120 [Paenibacillus montaniterrae]